MYSTKADLRVLGTPEVGRTCRKPGSESVAKAAESGMGEEVAKPRQYAVKTATGRCLRYGV